MLRALFLDMDGTLADTVPALYQIYLDFLRRHNVLGSQQEFAAITGPSLKEIIADLRERHRLPQSAQALFDEYMGLLRDHYRQNAQPFPGATEFLNDMRALGLQLVLVTSANRELADAFLKGAEWEGIFSVIVTGDNISKSKPHPDIYLEALKATGYAPSEVFVLEDSSHGVQAARDAGLRVVLVTHGSEFLSAESLSPDARADDFEQAAEFLQGMRG